MNGYHRISRVRIGWIVMALIFGGAVLPAWADLTINIVAVNAKEESREIEVKYYLPIELEPEEVIDAGPLQVDFDVDKAEYFVTGMVKFDPKESKTFKLKVKDVWFVTEEEVNILRNQLSKNLELLQKNENYNIAKQAADQITTQLDFIMAQQANYSNNIERRIEEYRAYAKMMADLRDKIYSLNYLENESKEIQELDASKTIKLVIEVSNPSAEETKTLKHKHYLPEGIRAEHVVESQGFEVRFDADKSRAMLTKEEEFKPSEKKHYEITIRDIWHISIAKVDSIAERAKLAVNELKDSMYDESGNFLYKEIVDKIALIKQSQSEETSIKKHIGRYKINSKRLSDAEEDLARIEQMLAIVRAKRLEELEHGKVKNVLQRLQALRGLAALSEALFKKGISVTVTWRIVFGTIAFVGFFTALHFFIWSRRSKSMGEERGPKDGVVKEVPKPGAEVKEE